MTRYIFAIDSQHDVNGGSQLCLTARRISESSVRWESVVSLPGFYAAYKRSHDRESLPLLLHNDRGLTFGTLYESSRTSGQKPFKPIRHLSPDQSEKIIQSNGRCLISEYWGHYVAVIRYPETTGYIVLRSPVSPLPCFYIQIGTVTIFFSHLIDYLSLSLRPTTINWHCITAQVVAGDYLTNETAINEITALECGEAIMCGRHGCSTRGYWDPRTLLKKRTLHDFVEASDALREAVHYSVNALSSHHDSILVKLSGGLDSSIVLHSLSRASHKPALTSVNYYSSGSGDERRFARCMAQRANSRLLEYPRDARLDLRRVCDCNWTVRPVLKFSALDTEMRDVATAEETGASAIFDGELGDNIFGAHLGPGALVESFRHHGLTSAFISASCDYAMLTKQSFWRTLSLAWKENRSIPQVDYFSAAHEVHRAYTESAARSLILASNEAVLQHRDLIERFIHPWFRQSRGIAPGSYILLFGLIVVTSAIYHSPFGQQGDPPRLSPLVSQPLAEIALQIPDYLHFMHGQDRAVARFAFNDAIPELILQRGTGKGGPGLWMKNVVEQNHQFIREFLLDGILVDRGLIDARKVEAAVSPRIEKSTALVSDLVAKLYIEAWLRKWPYTKIH